MTFNKTGSTTSLTGIAKLVFADREVQLKQVGNNAPEMFFGEGAQKIIEDELIPASEVGRWRHVYGGPGNDLIVWRSGQLKGGPGDDTIQFAGVISKRALTMTIIFLPSLLIYRTNMP